MKNRFRKVLSTLLAIALLVSGIVAVFAEEEAPVTVEETVTETAPAAEETPVAEEASNNEATAETAAPTEETVNTEVAPVETEAAPAETEAAPAETEAAPVETEAAPAETEAAAPAETEAAAPAEETAEEPIVTADETDDAPAADTESEIPEESNNAPAQEDAPAAEAEDESADEASNNEETASEEIVDELAGDTTVISEEDTQVMGEDAGYIDPEVVAENIPEVTPEMKYDNITELKIGSKVSGIAAEGSYHYIKSGKTQDVVLGLYADANVQVKVNDKVMKFSDDENEANFSTCELKLVAGETYIIELTAANIAYTLTAEAKAAEETTEATDEQSATPAAEDEAAQEETEEETTEEVVPAEDNNEETDTEETVADETENENNETENTEVENSETEETEETEDENSEDENSEDENSEDENSEDENSEDENSEDENNETEETVPAINAWVESDKTESAIGDQIILNAAADIELDNAIAWMTSADGEEWHKAGYGLTLTVELNEENANNFYRFRLADGTISAEYQIRVTADEVEEIAEENEESETPEEENEGEEAEDEELTIDEETEEETEEDEEESIEPLTDEQMIEMGFIKVYVAIDIGANVYNNSSEYEGQKPVDHLDVGTELWVKLIDGAERAQIFELNEEATACYINLVDIIATKKPSEMEELPTRELMIVSSLDGIETVNAGTINHLEVKLFNFREDDNYTVQWKYSEDGETFIDIKDANELEYGYMVGLENASYIWRVSVVLVTPEDMQVAETIVE